MLVWRVLDEGGEDRDDGGDGQHNNGGRALFVKKGMQEGEVRKEIEEGRVGGWSRYYRERRDN